MSEYNIMYSRLGSSVLVKTPFLAEQLRLGHYLVIFAVVCHQFPWSIWVCKGQAGELNEDIIGNTNVVLFKSLRVALITFFSECKLFSIYYLGGGDGVKDTL